MRARHFVFLACAMIAASAAACGDDDAGGSGGGGSVDTGLPASDKLADLDDEDAQQACKSTAKAFNDVLPQSKLEQIGCALAAIAVVATEKEGDVDSGDVAACKEIAQDCADGKLVDENGETVEIDTQVTEDSGCDTATAADSFQDCEATVADYERCASKVATEVRARLSSISCDALKDYAEFEASMKAEIDLSKAAECKAIRDKCPDVDLGGSAGGADEG